MRFARVKRVAAFILLVAAGFFLLELARGGGDLFPARTSAQEAGLASRPGAPSVDSDQVTVRGEFHYDEEKEVLGPGGTVHFFRTWELDTLDSNPLPGDRQELKHATLSFYRVRLLPGGEPHQEKLAAMKAKRMVMARAPGKSLKPAADKDLLIEDLVLTSLGVGVGHGLELRMQRARALPGSAGLRFRSEGELDPFELTVGEGDSAHRVTGKGLSGTVPAAGVPSTSGIALRINQEVHIEPLAERRGGAGTHMTGGCGGSMTYRSVADDQDRGVLLLAGGVELEVGGASTETIRAKGERLSLLVERSVPAARDAAPASRGSSGEGKLSILAGEMSGEAVELEAQGSVVRGQGLAFARGPAGQMERLRVTGQPRLLVPAGQLSAGEPVWIHAAEAIEVVVLPSPVAFGLPLGAPTRWTGFEGRTWTEGSSELSIESDTGLLVATGDTGGELWLRARGRSRLAMSATSVEGDEGLTLHRSADDALSVRVNPGRPTAAFSARRPGVGVLTGRGSLELTSDARNDGTIRLELRDPNGTITADLDGGRSLSGASHMTIVSRASRLTLAAEGTSLLFVDPLQGVRVEDARSIVAGEDGTIAIRGRQTAPADNGYLAVQGQHARLIRSSPGHERVVLTAFCVDLLPSGAGKPAILAYEDVRIETSGFALEPGSLGSFVLTCDRFAFLPALLPEGDAAFAFFPAGAPLRRALSADLGPGGPGWFRASGNVALTLRPTDGSNQVFHGATLAARMDGELAVLAGIGAWFEIERPGSSLVSGTADHLVKDGERLVIGRGGRLGGCTLWVESRGDLFSQSGPRKSAGAADARYQRGSPEALDPHPHEADHVTTRIDCENPIEVTRERLVTIGRTLVTTADDATGDPLPGELMMRCKGLDASLAGGEFTRVRAVGPVTMSRGTLSGKGAHLLCDPRTGVLTLEAGAGLAEIQTGSGLRVTSRKLLEYNVLTDEWRMDRGTLQ